MAERGMRVIAEESLLGPGSALHFVQLSGKR